MRGLLNGLEWPPAMAGLAPLDCYITAPNPNVQSEIPAAYIWMNRGRESRDTTRLKGGTIPRISMPGGPSGTKMDEYTLPVWLVWMMSADDPDADNLFPGMLWTVMSVLRGTAYGAGGQNSVTPAELTDPWTGEQSWLIDLGEEMRFETAERALDDQRNMWRFDAVIDCEVSELIAA